MIYTCTLNPSIDYIVAVDTFQPGAVNRANHTATFPGGKGINVSRVLKRLGSENTALGFLGGFTGDFIKTSLENEGIKHDFLQVNGDTRINVKLKANQETEINGTGPAITQEQIENILGKFEALQADDILVLGGSIPSSVPKDFYETITASCVKRGVKVIVDTTGTALKEVIPHRPFLLKPNHHELGELFYTEISSREDAVFYGRKLIEAGAQNVIVSMAGDGAILLTENEAWFTKPPKGEVKNSVGAGDSVIAGFVAAYSSGKTIEQSFLYGNAAGSATAFSEDLCTKELVESLFQSITLEKLC